ncbi:hypothetical protein [Mesonia sp. K4-1]|uniref:hypothetical protein n=1 Tax=Mesonia sp. K4-1 TaxID=2602760 RepID=UPI0011CB1B65|nr:hypothetical protein [Mesonia sp. K4-1]TXK75527.1 hypothetical protein FT986_08400 [Mesonia sp. K4-1]TXK75548.1 hypothetical protein FT986_08515 [Mesonia sp. K4-1]
MSTSNNLRHSLCEKYGVFCDKCQYNEASIWEKLKLKFHLFMCGECRKYSQKNTQLSEVIKNAKLSNLTPEEQESFKILLQKQMQNSSSKNS